MCQRKHLKDKEEEEAADWFHKQQTTTSEEPDPPPQSGGECIPDPALQAQIKKALRLEWTFETFSTAMTPTELSLKCFHRQCSLKLVLRGVQWLTSFL